MTIEEAKDLEKRVILANETKIVDKKLIEDIKRLLTKDGEVLVDECAFLSNHTALKITYRKINVLDKVETAIGVKFNDIGIEFCKY